MRVAITFWIAQLARSISIARKYHRSASSSRPAPLATMASWLQVFAAPAAIIQSFIKRQALLIAPFGLGPVLGLFRDDAQLVPHQRLRLVAHLRWREDLQRFQITAAGFVQIVLPQRQRAQYRQAQTPSCRSSFVRLDSSAILLHTPAAPRRTVPSPPAHRPGRCGQRPHAVSHPCACSNCANTASSGAYTSLPPRPAAPAPSDSGPALPASAARS